MLDAMVLTILQYAIVFCLTLVFSVIALERDSIVSNGLAMILWVVFAIMNFMVGYTLIGSALSYILGAIGFIFAGNFILAIRDGYLETKKARYSF